MIQKHFYCPLILEQLEPALDARFSTAHTLAGLTWREQDVLLLLSLHLSDKEIADALGISAFTVSSCMAGLRGKLGAPSRRALAELLSRLNRDPSSSIHPARL
jgi:DNA-binding CsgD family transcriptional regulator